ncbi:TolC family protein [Flavobacterium sp. xlx-214]|uniref:TolC family protein n=1 Tax=unclassified Flavobacterium TaxID=196869 RepID=UPI0013D3E058|nr:MULTISPECIES: TolC family protein [unclassified Flavobacterium]MBA5792303.1 TolC family protein [Flavobacterium sp. xlx-221]QMI82380.1 TolC family protein [Flavobacterium sp. xlx-214]
MKYRISVLLAFLGFFAQAQEKLTLTQAVNYALENKAEAVKARLDVQNSEYMIDEVRANALPQINATGGLTYNAILQETAMDFMGQSMVIKMGKPWQSTAVVSLNQQLFNQAVFTGLKAAKSTREFYKINAQLTEEQVIEKVANSYYEVYKTKSQITTIDKTITNTTRVRDVIKSLFDNGLAKRIDLDRTNVALNNIKSTRQQLVNALELQENALKYLIGMDINAPIELPENSFEVTKHALVDDTTNIENRTEIKLLEKQSELLALNKKATEAQGLPTLSLSANYGYLGIGDKFPWFQSYPGAYWSDFSSIGLNLSIPIFNGGSNKARIKQAQIDIDRLEVDKKDVRLALDLSLKNAVTQINNSLITLNTQKENVNLAQEVLTNVENNYKHGLASLTDLLDAETSFADAQNSYTNALLDYKLAEIQLIKAKGDLKTLTQTEN